jgi:hypothetical protein
MSAAAEARSRGETAFTTAAFKGPVDMNMRSSATMIAGRYTELEGVVRARNANGAASSVVTPESHR